MNKFKVVVLSMSMCLGVSAIIAQKTEDTSTKVKAPTEKAEALKNAKSDAAEIAKACRIESPKKISQIAQVLSNHATSVLILNKKEASPEDKVKLLSGLESDRDKRLNGMFSPDEVNMYTKYKQKKASDLLKKEASESESMPKEGQKLIKK